MVAGSVVVFLCVGHFFLVDCMWYDTCVVCGVILGVVVGYWTLGQQHTNQSHLPDITPATIFPNDDDR